MTTEVKDVVARLRAHEGIGAAMSPTAATSRYVCALMDEAASLLESLSSQVTEADRIAGNNAALWREACSMVDERNVELRVAESRATAAEGRVALLEEALGQHERVLLVNAVRQAALDAAPIWLEHADDLAARARLAKGGQ